MIRPHVPALALLLLLTAPAAQAQEASDGTLRLLLSGGLQSSPVGLDTFRPVEYGAGYHLGGGIALQLHENLAVRGEASLARNGGHESGVMNEEIDFERGYYSASMELCYPLASGPVPYLLAGGGFVELRRTAPSYHFNFTEIGGVVGAGVRMPLPGAGLRAFAQGSTWYYPNSSTGEGQLDPLLSIGLDYAVPF